MGPGSGKKKKGTNGGPPPNADAVKKYMRGEEVGVKKQLKAMEIGITDKKLRSRIKRQEQTVQSAVRNAVQTEMLLPSEAGYLEAEGLEQTFKFKQADIAAAVAVDSSRKAYSLDLNDFGPYTFSYSRSGRSLLLGGRKGHVALMDWSRGRLVCELHLKETVRDVSFLNTEGMFAVAQKKYTYIYDSAGVELHCLRKHIDVTRLQFLPYHFLLVTVGKAGYLKYQDTTTGDMVVEHRTKLGSCDCMRQNPYNAVIGLGHTNGTVTMWTPNMTTPVVKMLCHRASVKALAFDTTGNYMATAGEDSQIHIWDARKFGTKIWKDGLATKQQRPYMQHELKGPLAHDLHFCPFEDVMGVAHDNGFRSLIVPGAGMANFDTFEANPYSHVNKKQRQESEVKAMLEKLQPAMITLDPDQIGTMDRADHKVMAKEREEERLEQLKGAPAEKKERKRGRGRSTAIKRFLKKQSNVRDETRERILNEMKKRKEAKAEAKKEAEGEATIPRMLKRFKT